MVHILGDLESSQHGQLMIAILCALVVSHTGLTKAELRDILTRDSLQPPSPYEEKGEVSSHKSLQGSKSYGKQIYITHAKVFFHQKL